ncbi:hypothetical protein [[Limnothrix rosea] IAM M-220]|uniref:hypothetical protein n=1 Tax=[Limnothrix rosea] IAM M-220 TaxID=454133 RepID=UPI0009690F10|nr:hypothetical protein [[Limnothrix rosea] IAM M-220]OKH17127.1 hypothetical protein NIES208_10610 [[Limnothrix rosea] IAM M-220]
MVITDLNQEIIVALVHYQQNSGDRHFTRLYRLINQHPQLNRNQSKRYHPELFQEAVQEAWLVFYRKNLRNLLNKLETQGTAIAPENAAIIVIRIIKELNILIRNKNVDLWRKETIPIAA